MQPRAVAALVLFPTSLALLRGAQTAAIASHLAAMSEHHFDSADYSQAMRFGVGGALVAGILGVLSPRITLVAAFVATLTGLVLTALDGPDTFALGLRCFFGGSGAATAALYALAVLAMHTPRMRVLAVVITIGGSHAASFVAGFLGPAIADVFGAVPTLALLAAVVAIAAAASLVAVAVDKVGSNVDVDPEPAAPVSHLRALAGAAAMIAASAAWFVASAATSFRPTLVGGASHGTARIVSGAGSVLGLFALAGVVAWLLARDSSRPVPLSRAAGIGLLAVPVACAVSLLSPTVLPSAIAAIFLGLASATMPLAIARALSNHHRRVVTVIAGAWSVSSAACSGLGHGSDAALAVAGVVGLIAGGVLVVVGTRFDAWLDAPPPASPGSWLHGAGDDAG